MKHLLPGVPAAVIAAAFNWSSFAIGASTIAGIAATILFGVLTRRDRRRVVEETRKATETSNLSAIAEIILADRRLYVDQLQEDAERFRNERNECEAELAKERGVRRKAVHDLANAETKVNIAMQNLGEQQTEIARLETMVRDLGGEP